MMDKRITITGREKTRLIEFLKGIIVMLEDDETVIKGSQIEIENNVIDISSSESQWRKHVCMGEREFNIYIEAKNPAWATV
ncbi:MAG: hypothetical protein WC365_10360 [Candidatus Babeliales bacterium]|jgi:hypothetical protein